jgi:hypothetical protein
VHHTNEVAQSECASDLHPWVRIWMHNEFLDLGGEKMSKSKGHVLTVDSLVERGIDPLAFRYFFLQAHYRQQQAFTFELVEAAATALRRLTHHAVAARDEVGGEAPTGRATGRRSCAASSGGPWPTTSTRPVPSPWCPRWRAMPSSRRRGSVEPARRLRSGAGLRLAEASHPMPLEVSDDDPRVAALLADRQAARDAKDFATADRIRDELAAEGLEIVDSPQGPQVRRARSEPSSPSVQAAGVAGRPGPRPGRARPGPSNLSIGYPPVTSGAQPARVGIPSPTRHLGRSCHGRVLARTQRGTEQLKDWVHDFAVDVVRPAAEEWDEREEFPWPSSRRPPRSASTASTSSPRRCSATETGLTMPVAIEELFWGDAGIGLSIMGSGLAARASPATAPPSRPWSGCPSATAPPTT